MICPVDILVLWASPVNVFNTKDVSYWFPNMGVPKVFLPPEKSMIFGSKEAKYDPNWCFCPNIGLSVRPNILGFLLPKYFKKEKLIWVRSDIEKSSGSRPGSGTRRALAIILMF